MGCGKKIVVTTETIGGVAVQDSFRWLEDDADPEVMHWQRIANDRTVAELAASPHAATVAAAVRSTFEDLLGYWAPQHFGEHWFRTVQPPGSAVTVLEVSSSPVGKGRVLIDPRDHGADARLLLSTPSPDGRLVLVQLSMAAAVRLLVLDVADASVIRDLGEFVAATGIAWTRDGLGFFFRKIAVAEGLDGRMVPASQIWWQPVDGEAEHQSIGVDDPATWAIAASDGRWVAVMANQGAPRPVWIRRTGSDSWEPFLPDAAAMYKGVFVGDEYWAITDDTSGWCRLVAIPLHAAGDRSTWRELVPAREELKLASITRCGNHVALTIVESGVMRLHALDLSGRDRGNVPLPGDGAFGLFGLGYMMMLMSDVVAPDGDGCTFVFSALDRGCGVYRADLSALTLEELEPPVHALADRELRYLQIEGPHGPVPYRIMRKASTSLDGSAPVIVTGYGGFNVPQIPHYNAMAAAWTELGGIWVHAHLRGGGERDTEFWQGGRMHRKQGTFDDLYAVIEDLHGRGFATPERTGVWGTSNGGLLVGATVTQHPELIRAAVAQVPILDVIQCRKDPMTFGIVAIDYGNPNDPADAAVMLAYSPCHNVRSGVSYPALLCDAGANDTATPPWHSRKMVAAIQEASSSGRRTLLRVREGSGHNLMSRDGFIERDAEELTFFIDELSS